MKLSLHFHGMHLHCELYLINYNLSNASQKQNLSPNDRQNIAQFSLQAF